MLLKYNSHAGCIVHRTGVNCEMLFLQFFSKTQGLTVGNKDLFLRYLIKVCFDVHSQFNGRGRVKQNNEELSRDCIIFNMPVCEH